MHSSKCILCCCQTDWEYDDFAADVLDLNIPSVYTDPNHPSKIKNCLQHLFFLRYLFPSVCLKCQLLFNRTQTPGCTRAQYPAPQGSRAGVGCWLSEVLTPKLSTLCLSVTLHTLSLSHYTSMLKKLHALPMFFIRAQSAVITGQKSSPLSAKVLIRVTPSYLIVFFCCLCNRGRRVFCVQSFWVHPASGASAETCGDGGDQKHRHPHLAVQPSRRRGRCHFVHHRGLQVHMWRTDIRWNNTLVFFKTGYCTWTYFKFARSDIVF